MLEKLAKQTAVYGISTIAVRFLSYLLTPVFTRVFEPEAYGIVTDVYALIPFALVVLTMGLESAYFRFAAKADAAAAAAGGTEGEIAARARAGKRRLFATAWGVTLLAASLFFLLTAFGRERVAEWMGEATWRIRSTCCSWPPSSGSTWRRACPSRVCANRAGR